MRTVEFYVLKFFPPWQPDQVKAQIYFAYFNFVLAGLTLLEIKNALNDSRNILGNWRATDESPCKWTGISCHPHDQRVSSMYVINSLAILKSPTYIYIAYLMFFPFSTYWVLQKLALHAVGRKYISQHWQTQQTTKAVSSMPPRLPQISPGRMLKLSLLLNFLFFLSNRALHQNSLHGIIPYELTNCTELRAM